MAEARTYPHGVTCWVDTAQQDVDTAIQFYGGLFGWEFVEAARAMGASNRRIVLRHILPNLLSPLLVAVTVDMAGVILAEATLSYLGIGIQRPYPSWGRMVNDALEYYRTDPRLLILPSAALSLTVLALNFVGDGLRDALDPRGRK